VGGQRCAGRCGPHRHRPTVMGAHRRGPIAAHAVAQPHPMPTASSRPGPARP
jgi:hypothetical protein